MCVCVYRRDPVCVGMCVWCVCVFRRDPMSLCVYEVPNESVCVCVYRRDPVCVWVCVCGVCVCVGGIQ